MSDLVPFYLKEGVLFERTEQFDTWFKQLKNSASTASFEDLPDGKKPMNWIDFMKFIYTSFPNLVGRLFWMVPQEIGVLIDLKNGKNEPSSVNVESPANKHWKSVYERFNGIHNMKNVVALFLNGPSPRPDHIGKGYFGYRKELIYELAKQLEKQDFSVILVIPESYSLFDAKFEFNHAAQIESEKICREKFEQLTKIPLMNIYYVPKDVDGQFPGNTTKIELVASGQAKPMICYFHPSRLSSFSYSLSYVYHQKDVMIHCDPSSFLDDILNTSKEIIRKNNTFSITAFLSSFLKKFAI